MNAPTHNIAYRPEIDGLRAIAVLPVMLFHAGFAAFSGGFVGVDIFFVLSGYLITSIIMSEAERGEFSLLRFYERRARRILPALLLVVIVTVPFAYLWMTQDQWQDFAESLVGVATFSSNIVFWLQSGYFATASELKPLLHTWSLAVEEQFYIIFPLLIMLVLRINRRALLTIFMITGVASLVWSIYAASAYPSANFFLLPSRAWELLAGACCALWLRAPSAPDNISAESAPETEPNATAQKRPWRISQIPDFVQQLAALGGLVAIIIAITIFDTHTPFPSAYALLPVGGTMALILFLQPGFWLTRLLAMRPLVAIGLVSYGAYLWHQPILAFYRMTTYVHQPVILALLLLLSLLLAAISYWLVERPVRYSFLKSCPLWFFLGLSAAALAAIAAIGLVTRFSPPELPHEAATGGATYSGEGYNWRETYPGTGSKSDANGPSPLILYGDSVARQYITGLRSGQTIGNNNPQTGSFDYIGAPSCVSLPRAFSSNVSPQCRENINILYEMVLAKPDAITVIAQDWHVRLENEKGKPVGQGSVPQDPAAIEAMIFNLELVASRLPTGARLVMVGQVPSTQDGGDMLKNGPSRCAQYTDIRCPVSMPRTLVSAEKINRRLAGLAARFDHVGFVDPMDSLCDAEQCYFWQRGKPLYYDNSHLTALSADVIAQQITAVANSLSPKSE